MSEWLGDDGLVISALPHSPMQMLMIDWIGSEEGRFYFHHFDYPDLVEDLYRAVQKFFMPEYEKQAKVLHANGKLMAVHMDGRLDILKDLIAVTPIDIIEAFHPPPMGDLPASEALSLWRDRAVWVGFPGSVYSLGPGATKDYAIELLRDIVPGERVVFQMSTENLVSNENLLALTSVLQNAELPLTPDRISGIRRFLP